MWRGAETDRLNPIGLSTWARLSGLILLALLLTAAVTYRGLELSSLHGRLSVPPLYDDVGYMLDAVTWMDGARSRSLAGDVLVLLQQHGPFSSLVAAIGFSLFPDGYVGPYLVSSVVVLAFLLGIIGLTWTRPATDIATCLIAAACVPTVWHTVTEARPDLPWGLALGIALGAIVRRGVLQRSMWSLVALGVGCGLACSIKPSAFPASLACTGGVFAIRLFVDCIQVGGLRACGRRAITTLLVFSLPWLLTTTLLIGPGVVAIVGYIFQVFVSQRDLWSTGEGFWSGLGHFSVGAEGKAGLHFWLWIGIALMVLRLLLAAIRGRTALQEAGILLATLLIAYAIPSVAELKTYFFGAIFYGIFIVAIALNFCANEDEIDARIEKKSDRLVDEALSADRHSPAPARRCGAAVRQERRDRPDQPGDAARPATAGGHSRGDGSRLVAGARGGRRWLRHALCRILERLSRHANDHRAFCSSGSREDRRATGVPSSND